MDSGFLEELRAGAESRRRLVPTDRIEASDSPGYRHCPAISSPPDPLETSTPLKPATTNYWFLLAAEPIYCIY
jgi:hypothetical protein